MLIFIGAIAHGQRSKTEAQYGREESAALRPTTIFETVRPVLRERTRVPLRLPGLIEQGGEGMFAIVANAKPSTYEVLLAFDPDCVGAHVCSYGTVKGSVNSLTENEGRRAPITLSGGIKGYFINFKCFAYCNESVVGWTENGFHYSIAIKAERKAVLIKVANSAIEAASQKSDLPKPTE
jgi:hypothetical protein